MSSMPKLSYERLEKLYAELAAQFRSLRDQKSQPAPNDSPWQVRFAALDRECLHLHKEHSVAVLENAKLKLQVSALMELLEGRR